MADEEKKFLLRLPLRKHRPPWKHLLRTRKHLLRKRKHLLLPPRKHLLPRHPSKTRRTNPSEPDDCKM
jgi:hypothetical protein